MKKIGFVLIGCFIIGTLFMLLELNRAMESNSSYIIWGLGVDVPCFYSRKLTIRKNSIQIKGFQKVLNENTPVYYSVVTVNWWGKMTVYREAKIYKDFKQPNSFTITFTDLPNGDHYRVFLYHYGNMAKGKFKIVTD
ncbi:MAG TPA: hypothetical protein GX497_10615 [Bacillus bacterium]|nr:hypothetical protein [Bacillus sp. (in: firmicutes)]